MECYSDPHCFIRLFVAQSPSGQVTVKAAVDCIAEVLQLWAKVPDEVKAVRENTADFYNIVGFLIGNV